MNVNRNLMREKLEHGDMSEIARSTGTSRNTVYAYFTGRTKKFNRKYTELALDLIQKKSELEKNLQEALTNLD
jgi:AcrR family transcriptional regulator